jgi:biopolymer transport protein ExbB
MWDHPFIQETLHLWQAGGALMYPLAGLAALIYASIFELNLYLRRHNFHRTDPDLWGHWIDAPHEAKNGLGEIIRFTSDGVRSVAEIRARFAEVAQSHLPAIEARLTFATILTGAAPLLGLLGTVMGMLSTFAGLSVSAGGETVDLVAGGISEALITTQAGLVIAIPAYVMVAGVRRQLAAMTTFFTQLEIATILRFERRARAAAPAVATLSAPASA